MPRPLFGLFCFAVCASAVVAQPPPGLPSPRIQNVVPAGVRIGSTVDVALSGSDLDEPTGLLFSHPGLKGEYVPPPAPDPKKPQPPADQREKAASRGPHNFKVTAEAAVPPGLHDVRVVTRWGVSNPRAFLVGSLPEVNEKEPNNDVPEAQRVEIGTTINGTLASATDVDYTVFAGKKGQRVLVSALASTLDGKARPLIEIYDAAGRKLAANRNYDESDALADLLVPADGDYLIRVCEFAYAGGGPDHTYRLTVTTGPWIDAVYPPVIEPGKPANVTVYGRNLPGGSPSEFRLDGHPLEKLAVTVVPPADANAARMLTGRSRVQPAEGLQDGFEYRLAGPNGTSNPVTIYFAREKLHLRKSPGGLKPETAEPIALPGEVVGFIAHRNDRDWYSFEAKKGDVLMIDLQAERIGTRADYFFTIHFTGNKNQDLLGEVDDETESLHTSNFATRTTDPAPLRWTVPFDGKFLIQVAARESATLSGPRTAYRLRVAPPRPDFRAVVLPYSRYYQTGSTAWQGGTEAYDVFVHRVDGFKEPVTVLADGLPPGVTAKPLVIGPGARWGTLTLQIAADAKPFTGPFRVKATAEVDGKPVTDLVRPASILWGSRENPNQPLYCRMTQSLVLAVRPEKAFFAIAADLAKATLKVNNKDEALNGTLTLKEGEKATFPVKATWTGPEKPNVTLTAEQLGPNASNNLIAVQVQGQPTKEKPETAVTVEIRPNATPGTYSFTLRGNASVPFAKDAKGTKTAMPVNAFSDPITVTVLPSSLARLTLEPAANGSVKPGQSLDVLVKIERQFGYAGAYVVSFAPPKDAKGIAAADVTVPAGRSDANLTIKVDPGAKPGNGLTATVKVVANVDKFHAISHEAKMTFNILK